jgi:hypothetical protein
VRTGGLVALHPIQPRGHEDGVPRFWSELNAERGGVALVEDPAQQGFGIGAMHV